jgi:DNA polymerase-1
MFLRRSAAGLRVDLEYLDAYRAEVSRQQDADRALLAGVGVKEGNAGSLTGWLSGQGLLPATYPRTPKTGAASGQADDLEKLHHPLAQAFVRLKKSEKVLADYLQKVVDLADEHDRIHPETGILAATTGRMSMSDPPLQQFPGDKVDEDTGALLARGARGIVLADEGDALTSIDWSQIEPVVAANVAHDHAVLADYEALDRSDKPDIYMTIAQLTGITRKKAKVVVLAQMYGEGMTSLASKLNITLDEAYDLRRAVFRAMPRVEGLIGKLREIGRDHRLIFTLSGRILTVPMGRGFDGGPPSVAVHKAVNYFVQGSAYDVLAEVLVRVDEAGLGDAVYLAMHDELVISTEAANDIAKIMAEPPDRLCEMAGRTPVLRIDRADLGERWAAA